MKFYSRLFRGVVVTVEAVIVLAIFAFCAAFVGGCGDVSVESGAAGAAGKLLVNSGGTGGSVSTGGAIATGGSGSSAGAGGVAGAGGEAGAPGGSAGVGGGAGGGAPGTGGSQSLGGMGGAPCLPDPWYLDLSPQKVPSEVALDFLYQAKPVATALTSYQVVQLGGNVLQVDGSFAFGRTDQVDSTGEDLGPAATGQVWLRLGNCNSGQNLVGKTVSFSIAGGAVQQPALDVYAKLYLARSNSDGSTDVYDPGFSEVELQGALSSGVPNYKGTVTIEIANALSGGPSLINYLIIQVRERLGKPPSYSTTGDGAFRFYVRDVYVGSNSTL